MISFRNLKNSIFIAVIAVEFHDKLVFHYVFPFHSFLMSASMRCVVNYLPRL